MTEEKEQSPKSFIYIEFEEVNSNNTKQFSMSAVSPFQMWAMGKYLEYKATQMMYGVEMQEAKIREDNKIIVPKPKIEL
jgi:hypothetical protein